MIGRFGIFLAALLIGGTASAQTKLAVGYGFASDFLPAIVAVDEGIFSKHGLDVTLSTVQNTSMAPALLTANTVQIVVETPPNLIIANTGGLDQIAIAGAARLTKQNQRIGLITRTGLIVTQPADLKGKRIGVPGINSVIDMGVKKWFLDHGVALDQATFTEVVPPQMGDLLKGNQLDAVGTFEPLLSRFVASGVATRSVDFLSEENPDVLGSFWAATRDWANANSATVVAFRTSLIEAQDLIAKDPDKAKAVETKFLHFAEGSLPTYKVEITPADFDFFVALSQKLGIIQQPLDTSKLIFK
jgi:NitT/TauT family transport system substrate-binding protein